MPDYTRHVMWYTVWDAKTGDLIASGTADQCGRRLGYSSSGCFASAVSHWMHDSRRRHYKYTIRREYIPRSEVDSLPQRRKRKKKKPSGVTSAGEPAKGC